MDQISTGDYRREEDPRLFCSERTGRGPLSETWWQDYSTAIRESADGACDRALMCAYKLCKVEFRYWGMQGKIERFIHDIGTEFADCLPLQSKDVVRLVWYIFSHSFFTFE